MKFQKEWFPENDHDNGHYMWIKQELNFPFPEAQILNSK